MSKKKLTTKQKEFYQSVVNKTGGASYSFEDDEELKERENEE